MSINITQSNNQSINIQEGDSSVVSIETVEGTNVSVVERGQKGDPGVQGEKGEKGDQGETGAGVKEGGATSTFLVKSSATDYDTEWTSDLSSNSIVNTNTIFSIGSISSLGSIATSGPLSAGSVSSGGPITAGSVSSDSTTTATVNITGAGSQSIVYQGLIYDDFKLLSTGNIVNIIDSNNDGVNKQFIVADYAETPLMVVDEGGNVGIGTTTPSEALNVVGNIESISSSNPSIKTKIEGNRIYFSRGSDGGYSSQIGTYTNSGGMWMQANQYIRITDGTRDYSTLRGSINGGNGLAVNMPFNSALFSHTISAYAEGDNMLRLYRADGLNTPELQINSTSDAINFRTDGSTSNTEIAWSQGASERMRIDADGRVGIGTTTPQQKLQVEGGMRFASDGAGANYMELSRLSSNQWKWDTSGVGEIMRQAGNLTTWKQDFRVERAGLTVAPTLGYAARAINIDHTWNSGTTNFATIDIDVTDTASAGNSSFIDIAKGGTTGFIIDEDFNVGIGTATPSALLHVDGGASSVWGIMANSYNRIGWSGGATQFLNGWSGRIAFHLNGLVGEAGRFSSSGEVNRFVVERAIHLGENSGDNGDVRFTRLDVGKVAIGNSADDASGTLAVGNLGIGTTTPSEALHVVGKVSLNDGNNNVIIGDGATIGTSNSSTALGYQASGEGSRVVALGYQAQGGVVTNGWQNVGVGYQANYQNASENSVAVGAFSSYLGAVKSAAVGTNANYSGSDNSVAVGYEALKSATSSNTTAVGYQALTALTTGTGNTAVGYQAASSVVDQANITAIGYAAGQNATTPHSVFVGTNAGQNYTTGDQVVAIGYNAASISASGQHSIYIGGNAGAQAAGADRSIAIGQSAGYFLGGVENTLLGGSAGAGSGASNYNKTVGVGYQALRALTTGSGNTAIGYQAGYDISESAENTLIGFRSGFRKTNSTGRNSALGYESLYSDTNGYDNTAIGYQALYSANPSYKNTAVGFSAGTWTTGNYNALLGSDAGKGVSGASTFSNTTAVGYQALTALTTGTYNTAIGFETNHNLQTGGQNTSLGARAGYLTGGSNNTAIGYRAGRASSNYGTFLGSLAGESTTADGITAVGYQALTSLTTGTGNTAVGYQAGDTLTTGNSNTMLGYLAGDSITTGVSNTIIGAEADGASNANRTAVTLIGHAANADGDYAVSIGWLAKASNFSTSVGTLAGGNSSNAEFNVFVGDSSGRFNSGDRNVFVGRSAGYSSGNSAGNVFLGYNAGYNETGSNKLYIENSTSATPLIYGEFDNDIVRVNGALEVTEGVTIDETGLASAGDYGKGSEVWYQGTGATTAGSLYYLNSSGDWANTDASAASTAKGMLAFAAGTDSDVDGMITKGFVYLGTDPGGSVGDQVFLSETANAATATAPSTSGAIVRVIGHKVATNVIYFNPSNDYFEVE